MDDRYWQQLFYELTNRPEFSGSDLNWHMPPHQYQSHLIDLTNRFINECRNICDDNGSYDLEMKLTKLNHVFISSFDVHFKSGRHFDFPYFKGRKITDIENEFAVAARAHFDSLSLCIDALNNIINNHNKRQRSSIKIEGNPFKLDLEPGYLQIIYKSAIRLGFIDKTCKLTTFVNLFLGRPVKEKLNWEKTVYSLSYFLKHLYQNNNRVPNGFWDAASQYFTVDGEQISSLSLMRPSKGENDNIERLVVLIDQFKNPE